MPQTPLFMRGMTATHVAFCRFYPPLIYYLTERYLFKISPPPHGKILKKCPDSAVCLFHLLNNKTVIEFSFRQIWSQDYQALSLCYQHQFSASIHTTKFWLDNVAAFTYFRAELPRTRKTCPFNINQLKTMCYLWRLLSLRITVL